MTKKKKRQNFDYEELSFTKDVSFGFVTGAYLGGIVFSIVASIMLTLIIGSPLFGQQSLIDISSEAMFEQVSTSWESSDIAASIAGTCSFIDNERQKAYCVYRFVYMFADYGKGELIKEFSNMLISDPDNFFNEEVVCRDISVLICATYELMGVDCAIITVPNHAYNEIVIRDSVYLVDATNGEWEKLRKVENE